MEQATTNRKEGSEKDENSIKVITKEKKDNTKEQNFQAERKNSG